MIFQNQAHCVGTVFHGTGGGSCVCFPEVAATESSYSIYFLVSVMSVQVAVTEFFIVFTAPDLWFDFWVFVTSTCALMGFFCDFPNIL